MSKTDLYILLSAELESLLAAAAKMTAAQGFGLNQLSELVETEQGKFLVVLASTCFIPAMQNEILYKGHAFTPRSLGFTHGKLRALCTLLLEANPGLRPVEGSYLSRVANECWPKCQSTLDRLAK
jgi:hypothetical protein